MQIPKGTVKSRKSDAGFFQPILPDTQYSSGNNFIRLQLPPKPQFSPKRKLQLQPKRIMDDFARPLSKVIDDKKNIIQIIPKKKNLV